MVVILEVSVHQSDDLTDPFSTITQLSFSWGWLVSLALRNLQHNRNVFVAFPIVTKHKHVSGVAFSPPDGFVLP